MFQVSMPSSSSLMKAMHLFVRNKLSEKCYRKYRYIKLWRIVKLRNIRQLESKTEKCPRHIISFCVSFGRMRVKRFSKFDTIAINEYIWYIH